jgi:hypothetical protein
VALLEKGVPLDVVSMLLGHTSIKTTEKHYAPWVKSRQTAFEDAVKLAWAQYQPHHCGDFMKVRDLAEWPPQPGGFYKASYQAPTSEQAIVKEVVKSHHNWVTFICSFDGHDHT